MHEDKECHCFSDVNRILEVCCECGAELHSSITPYRNHWRENVFEVEMCDPLQCVSFHFDYTPAKYHIWVEFPFNERLCLESGGARVPKPVR